MVLFASSTGKVSPERGVTLAPVGPKGLWELVSYLLPAATRAAGTSASGARGPGSWVTTSEGLAVTLEDGVKVVV